MNVQGRFEAALAWVPRQVGAGTKLVVMDGGDGRAVELARALRAAGRPRSYVLRGGFRAWQAAGLPVRASDGYASSPLDILADEVATIGAGVSGWCALCRAASFTAFLS